MNGIGRVRVLGPLALHADGVRSELSRLGYALGTVENHVRVMAHLKRIAQLHAAGPYRRAGGWCDTDV